MTVDKKRLVRFTKSLEGKKLDEVKNIAIKWRANAMSLNEDVKSLGSQIYDLKSEVLSRKRTTARLMEERSYLRMSIHAMNGLIERLNR